MAQTCRYYLPMITTGWRNYDWNGVITANSIVHISASEYDPNNKNVRFGGSALISVRNVVPHGPGVITITPPPTSPSLPPPAPPSPPNMFGNTQPYVYNTFSHNTTGTGGVAFFLQIDWTPWLNVAVDITVFDAPTQTYSDPVPLPPIVK